jgi:hypothetical protein
MLPANYLLKCNKEQLTVFAKSIFCIDSEMYSYWILYSTLQQADKSNLSLIYIWSRRWDSCLTKELGFNSQQGQVFHTESILAPGPPSLLSSGYWGLFPEGVKWPGCEVDHSSPHSVKVKNGGAILPLQMSSWHGAWLITHRDNFTFIAYMIIIQPEEGNCNDY